MSLARMSERMSANHIDELLDGEPSIDDRPSSGDDAGSVELMIAATKSADGPQVLGVSVWEVGQVAGSQPAMDDSIEAIARDTGIQRGAHGHRLRHARGAGHPTR